MLTVKTPDEGQWRHCVFIFNFEQISHIVLVFSLLVLNKQMPAKDEFACHQRRYWLWFCVPPKMINYKKNAKHIFPLLEQTWRWLLGLRKPRSSRKVEILQIVLVLQVALWKKRYFLFWRKKTAFGHSTLVAQRPMKSLLSICLSLCLSICPCARPSLNFLNIGSLDFFWYSAWW